MTARKSALERLKRNLPSGVKIALKAVLRPRNVVVLPRPPSYCEDGFATIHSCGFIEDPAFKSAYKKGEDTGSWAAIRWRAHVYSWFALQCFRLRGDFVECGVNRGGYARMLFDYLPIESSDKRFFLLDTFEGFSLEQLTSEEIGRGIPGAYDYRECFSDVKETFAPFTKAVLVRGRVPDTLCEVDSDSIAFLSIDMNCAEPEIAAAEYFWDRLCPGGVILLDDYGHPLHAAQKVAFDAFAVRHDVKILHLPTEQGVIVKP